MALGLDTVLVGCWTDDVAATGATVILPPPGTVGSVSVRGAAPGTREAAALSPHSSGVECHGVVLCGSSVFGLAAADGVVGWCSDHRRGLELAGTYVPVVAAAVVFDLTGPDQRRPTAADGRLACEAASVAEPAIGRVGVGRGCTAAKVAGRDHSVPGGQGVAVIRRGDLVVGAIVAVNPGGEVVGPDGRLLAATTAPDGAPRFPDVSMAEAVAHGAGSAWPEHRGNTTIGCVVTNARLSKLETYRCADLAHGGIVEAVRPAHTSLDGDALFALATGEVDASVDLVALLAQQCVAEAIRSVFA